MVLLPSVIVECPDSCEHCLFGSDDSDYGAMCCGQERDSYSIGPRGVYQKVVSPQDALEHDCFCMFVSVKE